MADFDLLQTDAQVQSILNDGQSAMGASAQTTLTTEYVMLKDTNGVYHKILKSSFTEAIRDTLAGLLVNNDKGTTINQIAAIASGDFGSITPSNLASVLGVSGYSNAANFVNPDTLFTPGIYAYLGEDPIGLGENSGGIVEIYRFNNWVVQRANLYDANHKNEIYQRTYNSTWSAWRRII